MEAKPIFVIQVPAQSKAFLDKVRKNMAERLNDYHVVLYASSEIKEPRFSVLNGKHSGKELDKVSGKDLMNWAILPIVK